MIFSESVGSRASLSANNKDKSAASQQLTADLILYTYKNTYKLRVSGFFRLVGDDVRRIVSPV